MRQESNPSLFEGTAYYYSKFRPEFPEELVDFLVETYHLDGTGILLDMGCGTGISTFPLAKYFEQVIAFDADKEMLHVAKQKSINSSNITFLLQTDEEIKETDGPYKLVLASRSFHWMKQEKLLKKLHKVLEKDGYIIIISDGSFWGENEVWQKEVKTVVQSFLGEKRRAGNTTYHTSCEPYQVMLQRHGYQNIKEYSIPVTRIWNIERIIGYLYSTSFSAKHLYKNRVKEFENKLRNSLLKINQGKDHFTEHATFTIISGQNGSHS